MRKPLTPTQKMRRCVQAKIRRIEKKGGYVPEEIKQRVQEARYQTLVSMHRDKFSRLKTEIAETFEREWAPSEDFGDNPFEYDYPYSGDIVMQNVEDTINMYPGDGAELLRDALSREVKKYGRDTIAKAMANAEETLVKNARDIAEYTKDSKMIHKAFKDFFNTIKGERLKNGDAEAVGSAMDRMTDMGNES